MIAPRDAAVALAIAIAAPTLYGLAMHDADWLLAAFTSPAALAADPIEGLFALAAVLIALWAAHRAAGWFAFSRSASMLVVGVIALAILWPWVDQREFVHDIHDRYRSFRNIDVLFWRDHPGSVAEGALIGALSVLAWFGYERVVARKS